MFENELRVQINKQVQIVTPLEVVTGILVSVTSIAVTVRTAEYPGYGGADDVPVRLDTIAYVRVFA